MFLYLVPQEIYHILSHEIHHHIRYGDIPVTLDCELVDEVESMVNDENAKGGRCSYMADTSPPIYNTDF